MEVKDFFQILKRRKGAVVSSWLIFIIIGIAITFIQPLKYEARSRLLFVQNIAGADPYTVSKSNEYLSSLFSQVVYSSSFFDIVTSSSNFDIDKDYFSDNYKRQMKVWQKTIAAKSNDAGIIEISVYHPNTYQAKQIALAVNDALINQGFNYQGSEQGAKIKIIDQPLLSNYPVKPNIAFNLVAFSALGLISGLLYIYYFPGKRQAAAYRTANQAAASREARAYAQERTAADRHFATADNSAGFKIHPAEKVIITENGNREDDYQPAPEKIEGNIRNVINRF